MTAHFYNNAVACAAVYLHQDDDAILTGNPHTMSVTELLLTFWFFGVIFLLSTYYLVHMTKRPSDKMMSSASTTETDRGGTA